MKILLIQSKDDDSVAWLGPFSKKMEIPVEICPVTEDGDGNMVKQFTAFFDGNARMDTKLAGRPTHVLIFSPVDRRWFDFLAGFSYGSCLPCVVYGKNAITAIPDDLASSFIAFKTRGPLEKYLEAEYEIFKKNETVMETRKARDTLLNMGIPVDEESLAACVDQGRIQDVCHFLAAGFTPDTRTRTGIPLLNISARKGNREMLRLLLRSGARPNQLAADRDSSALIDCTMRRHEDMVRDLIEAGADVNIIDKEGQSALILAAGAGDEGIVEALLKAGADPDVQDSMGMSGRKYALLFHKDAMIALFETFAPKQAV